ncbi:MAG: dihydrofolate reductase [Citrobacter freundii]|nr:MAG: dihydrofolate reductase [Citrobacter freundii]
MRKLIAATNMSLDGFCDHTSLNPDGEVHDYYTDMLRNADTIIYGRITYQLMEDYWPAIVKAPTGEQSTDDFAKAIDDVGKLVFSRTLKKVEWRNARIATGSVEDEIMKLKCQPGKDLFVGSPGMIVTAINLQLVDELWICVHPAIVTSGLSLLKNIQERIDMKLLKTRTFGGGAVLLNYEVKNNA